MQKVNVKNTEISVITYEESDYISITDIAKFKSDEPNAVIANWMRNRNTIEYLGIWESLYNPDFKPLEFEGFKKNAGLNAFTLSPSKWVDKLPQNERLVKLNKIAIQQMQVLENIEDRKLLIEGSK